MTGTLANLSILLQTEVADTSLPAVPLAFLGGFAVVMVFYLAFRRMVGSSAYKLRVLSPERIAAHRHDGGAVQPVEALAASIAERANAICRAISEDPSEIRAEMCAMGYRRCAEDVITLTHRIDEESASSTFARRIRMKRARKKAVEALVKARRCLPHDALRATRQEQ